MRNCTNVGRLVTSVLGFRRSAMLVGLIAITGSTASASTLINDTFTGDNGTLLTSHAPDVNVTGNAWQQSASIDAKLLNNTAALDTFGNAGIDITSITATQLTVSATINPNDVTDGGAYWNNVGLGFFSSLSTSQSFFNFTGLVIKEDGTLSLQHQGTDFGHFDSGGSAAYAGTWVENADHTLSYTIDRGTGIISDINFDGYTAPYAGFAFDPSTNYFTTDNTAITGFYLQNGNGSATPTTFDNFQLSDSASASLPEPTAATALGAVSLLLGLRRRSRQI